MAQDVQAEIRLGTTNLTGDLGFFGKTLGFRLDRILLALQDGDLAFDLAVADVTDPPTWVIEEVVGVDDATRPDVSGYSLEFTR